ncbi:hypothetical protein DPMN_089175 [Dreissena polymorpha]|uniref:Uncharacterized protein n=1 Tax=Dreissena polymorpha TaxID=45954 RepID=A0A9D4QXU0_DREPO|nr:hypothetical protein DPMN_089175 [Dreissena polymorpha]
MQQEKTTAHRWKRLQQSSQHLETIGDNDHCVHTGLTDNNVVTSPSMRQRRHN